MVLVYQRYAYNSHKFVRSQLTTNNARRLYSQQAKQIKEAIPKTKNQQQINHASLLPNTVDTNAKVGRWLLTCAGLVFGMVAVGGLTRLTKSGLSMTDWKFHGGLPPLTQEAWEAEFAKYQAYPEFNRSSYHSTFNLSDFKKIYFWEYSHRMYGRLIGFAFTLPLGYYIYKGYINRNMYLRLFGLFTLGASQGLVGWWMVKSGLYDSGNNTYNNLPKVSPYRLSTHLTFAFLIYGLLLYNGFGIYAKRNKLLKMIVEFNSKQLKNNGKMDNLINIRDEKNNIPKLFNYGIKTMGLITFMTVIMGAFVAGNEAGLIYNEWPKMGVGYIPTDLINENINPKWKNIFEYSTMVQFIHRNLAYATVIGFIGLYLYSMRLVNLNKMTPYLKYATGVVASASILQATLGVFTLINHIPIHLASLHQMGSLTVLTGAIWLMFLTRKQSLCHSKRLMNQLLQHGKPKFLIA